MQIRVAMAGGSSARWLARQRTDPFRRAGSGYRSRAAHKLLWCQNKHKLIKPGAAVLDLGAAPGSWTQVALDCGAGKVVAVDINAFNPARGAIALRLDLLAQPPDALAEQLRAAIGGRGFDVVLSDTAPATTGNRQVDHARSMELSAAALRIAASGALKRGGNCYVKLFQGGDSELLRAAAKTKFRSAQWVKPAGSRSESKEIFLFAQGFTTS